MIDRIGAEIKRDTRGKAYGLRRLLFRLEPERAHSLTLRLLALAGALPPIRSVLRQTYAVEHPALRTRAFGLDFPNPVGLAAGYDKDGVAMHGLACLGFGHIEVGTVTPQAQAGNPRPRLHRLQHDRALINRMGFPNQGIEALIPRLKRRPPNLLVGANVGKGVRTALERAWQDYAELLVRLYPHVDYLAVNVSSPNTPELRQLQMVEPLERLLSMLRAAQAELGERTGKTVPLLVKLSPDLEPDPLARAVEVILRAQMDGVILTNTTVDRPGVSSRLRDEPGGLSGEPLYARSLNSVRRVHQQTGDALPIVGVGGISSPERVSEMLAAGAALVQIYSGLVYQGPGLVRELLRGLLDANPNVIQAGGQSSN